MKIDFAQRRVLVTGGTRGIGEAIGLAFAQAGAKVILTGTSPSPSAPVQIDGGGQIEYWKVDFTEVTSFNCFLERVANLDLLDVLVNNAGINRIYTHEELASEALDEVLDVNLRAPFLISKAASPSLKRSRQARIVNITSIWSVKTKAGRSAYVTSKFGLVGLTKTLAVELAPHNVLVNSVAPGFTHTDLTARSLSSTEQSELAAQIPLGRFARTDEIASVVLFLASSQNTYLTGQNIVVDGGFVCV